MKNQKSGILLPISVVLFILLVLTFPLVVYGSYAGRSESPEHILTYKSYKLTWDTGTSVDENGMAELSLFDAIYDNAESEDGAKIIAPGTGTVGDCTVRLKNSDKAGITYTALVYYEKSSSDLPIAVSLANDAGTETDDYTLPADIGSAQIAKAVRGKLNPGQIQDFDLNWYWLYEDGRSQDILDTALGDKAAAGDADDVIAGIFIYVELEDEPTTEQPSTADPASTEEPTTREPDTEQPSTADPASTEESTTQEPDTEQPSTADPATTEIPTTETPDSTETPTNPGKIITPTPQTGDDTMVAGYLVLLCMSGAMVVILAITRRRSRRDDEESSFDNE